MKKLKKYLLFVFIMSVILFVPSKQNVRADTANSYDSNMQTQRYDTYVRVGKDGSYTVTESIGVVFLNPRHGIYRNIPLTGISTGKDKKKSYYYTEFKLISNDSDSNLVVDDESSYVAQLRFGDEDKEVDQGTYSFTYKLTPQYQDTKNDLLYYNIFPSEWKNKIPQNSSFSIQFPKKTDLKKLKFYYGENGEIKDATKILDLKYDKKKNYVAGVLKQDLDLGEGITCYGNLGSGYFTRTNQIQSRYQFVLYISVAIFILTSLMFVFFGRSKRIKATTTTYQPPYGIDSAIAGYIWKGRLTDKDVLSLIYYWADKGYIKIYELGRDDMELMKLQDLPNDAPEYQKIMFQKLFEENPYRVVLSSLKYKFADTIKRVKIEITKEYSKKFFTRTSKIASVITLVLSAIPLILFNLLDSKYCMHGFLFSFIIFMIIFVRKLLNSYNGFDKYKTKTETEKFTSFLTGDLFLIFMYVIYAYQYAEIVQKGEAYDYTNIFSVILIFSLIEMVYLFFMMRRTKENNAVMNQLMEFHNFMEAADHGEFSNMADTNPENFYHILPYAMAMNEYEEYTKKLDILALQSPDWYESDSTYPGYPDYYDHVDHFYRNMGDGLDRTCTSCLTSSPSDSSSSSGDGGCSGGGCGGGGGGSW